MLQQGTRQAALLLTCEEIDIVHMSVGPAQALYHGRGDLTLQTLDSAGRYTTLNTGQSTAPQTRLPW